jgi:BirA family biotin operon repressor/biotin-[acetyl-CoA-carboxylase] ligase
MMHKPKPLTFALLGLLADGEFHSGQLLAQRLGISRASVNNALRDVDSYGLELYRVRGRGYRLSRPVQWLDAGLVADGLGELRRHFSIEVLDSAPSSNTLLLQRAMQGAGSGSVLAVEWQSSGRGRLGRPWYSSLGGALTFSVLWRFDCGLSGLSGLSLATGVAMMRALQGLGVEKAGLKWPNDVLGAQGKLAGILIEAQGDMLGPSAAVIGIGLNLSLPQSVWRQVNQPVAALADMLDKLPDRNYLLAVLLRELHGVLKEFPAPGFASLRAEWGRYHALQNRPVQLLLADGGRATGIARGVAEDGALELETDQGLRRFNSGEISLRGAT